jgi:hypothetical protein
VVNTNATAQAALRVRAAPLSCLAIAVAMGKGSSAKAGCKTAAERWMFPGRLYSWNLDSGCGRVDCSIRSTADSRNNPTGYFLSLAMAGD